MPLEAGAEATSDDRSLEEEDCKEIEACSKDDVLNGKGRVAIYSSL